MGGDGLAKPRQVVSAFENRNQPAVARSSRKIQKHAGKVCEVPIRKPKLTERVPRTRIESGGY